MTKASNNPYPSILIVETVDPAAPAAGRKRLFIDTDHHLKTIDSSSVVVDFTPAGAETTALQFVIDGGTEAITTGVKGDLEVPFACTVTGWRLFADQSGSIVIDVWKDTYANFPPVDADAMPGSGKEPTITTATKAQDTSITDWTTDDIAAGDILRFNVDSCATITRVTLSLTVVKA
jgi:hypothetical protein